MLPFGGDVFTTDKSPLESSSKIKKLETWSIQIQTIRKLTGLVILAWGTENSTGPRPAGRSWRSARGRWASGERRNTSPPSLRASGCRPSCRRRRWWPRGCCRQASTPNVGRRWRRRVAEVVALSGRFSTWLTTVTDVTTVGVTGWILKMKVKEYVA